MLINAYPPRYSGGFFKLGESIVIVESITGPHQSALVGGILTVQVHVGSPAWAGMLMHDRWSYCVSIDHGRD